MSDIDVPKINELGTGKMDPAAEQRMLLLHDLMDEPRNTTIATRGGGPLVSNIGQIEGMTMPDHYQAGRRVEGTYANNFFQDYCLSSNPEVKFYFEYRGRRMTDAAAQNFKDILDQPPHIVNAAEQAKLREVFRRKSNSDEYKIMLAKTEDLNGKRVLVLETRNPNQNLTSRTIYVNADGEGKAVQEITFQAPTQNYLQHLPAAMTALKTIKWK